MHAIRRNRRVPESGANHIRMAGKKTTLTQSISQFLEKNALIMSAYGIKGISVAVR